MQPSRVRPDVEQIEKIVNWLETWPERRSVSKKESANKRPFSSRTLLKRTQLGSA
jgi:hypothetical protein